MVFAVIEAMPYRMFPRVRCGDYVVPNIYAVWYQGRRRLGDVGW